MRFVTLLLVATALTVGSPSVASAGFIAQWQFSPTNTAGLPQLFSTWHSGTSRTVMPEIGTGLLTATTGAGFTSSLGAFSQMAIDTGNNSSFTAGDGTYSLFAGSQANQAGNIVSMEFSTLSAYDLSFSVDAMGGNNRVWGVDYSLDGSTFTGVTGSLQAPGPVGVWNRTTFDLSAIDAIENQPNVILRLKQPTASQLSYVVRLDNFTISADQVNAVPEPSSIVLLGLSLAAIGGLRLRRKRQTTLSA